MFEINPAQAKMWSRFGSRATFGSAMLELCQVDDQVLIASADLVGSSGLDRLRKTSPEKVINVGIAEQNLIGVAAGLAREDFTVFATSFAPFITLRASEQIRMNLGYMKANVKAVGLGGGLAMAHLGNSHYGLEDVAVMRTIPNLTILCPADGAEIHKAVFAAAAHKGPVYLRLSGTVNLPIVYQEDYDFTIGKSITLRQGGDLAIIAAGSMVYHALQAAGRLAESGLECTVINMHTIKPLDTQAIDVIAPKVKALVTVEEHTVIGGLGSAVSEHLAQSASKPAHLILGLPDKFGVSGEYNYLLEKYALTGEGVAESIKQFLNSH